MKTEYIIFYRAMGSGEKWEEAGHIYAKTNHEAINNWLKMENKEFPLAACDIAAVATWAFKHEHYDGSEYE